MRALSAMLFYLCSPLTLGHGMFLAHTRTINTTHVNHFQPACYLGDRCPQALGVHCLLQLWFMRWEGAHVFLGEFPVHAAHLSCPIAVPWLRHTGFGTQRKERVSHLQDAFTALSFSWWSPPGQSGFTVGVFLHSSSALAIALHGELLSNYRAPLPVRRSFAVIHYLTFATHLAHCKRI